MAVDKPASKPELPQAIVEREGHVLRITPPSVDELPTYLRSARHVADCKRGGQIACVAESLVVEAGGIHHPYLRCDGGLENVVGAILMAAGHSVHHVAHPVAALAEPDLSRLGPYLGANAALLDFVRGHHRGLIHYRRGAVEPVALVAALALAYPDANVLVVGPNEAEVVRFAARLRRFIPEARWATGRSTPPRTARVAVVTFGRIVDPIGNGAWVYPRDRDLVLVLDPVAALGARARDALGLATRARLFGLMPLDQQVAPRDADGLAALFGFSGLDIPRHGYLLRSVSSMTMRIEGGPRLAPRLSGVELERDGLWRHPVRNRRLARLAAAVADDDRARMAAELPELVERLPEGRPARVALMAANIEQALALAARLTGWPIVAGPEVNTVELTERDLLAERLDLDEADNSPTGRWIATPCGLARLDPASIDVVIRADGGQGVPPALEALTEVPADVTSPLMLIDTDDRHHPSLRRRARARREAYDARGWVGHDDPAIRAASRFLLTRPGVTS